MFTNNSNEDDIIIAPLGSWGGLMDLYWFLNKHDVIFLLKASEFERNDNIANIEAISAFV